MAKYVCDFDQVYQIGQNVCETATELETSVKEYSENVDSDLSGWDGKAKNSFTNAKYKEVSAAQKDFTYLNELGDFIKTSAESIESLEEQLSSITI